MLKHNGLLGGFMLQTKIDHMPQLCMFEVLTVLSGGGNYDTYMSGTYDKIL